MPQMTSEEEGTISWILYSKSLQAKQNTATTPLCRFWNHDQVANYLKLNYKIRIRNVTQEGIHSLIGVTWLNQKYSSPGTSNPKLCYYCPYDSAPHPLPRSVAMDQATILESVRVYLRQEEYYYFLFRWELGLNGAALFVTQHKWAKRLA
jgi:hypothetical protein